MLLSYVIPFTSMYRFSRLGVGDDKDFEASAALGRIGIRYFAFHSDFDSDSDTVEWWFGSVGGWHRQQRNAIAHSRSRANPHSVSETLELLGKLLVE